MKDKAFKLNVKEGAANNHIDDLVTNFGHYQKLSLTELINWKKK